VGHPSLMREVLVKESKAEILNFSGNSQIRVLPSGMSVVAGKIEA